MVWLPVHLNNFAFNFCRSATGKYYASLLGDDGMEAPVKPALISNVTGLDMGLAHFVIKSDGNKIASPRHLNNASRNLRQKQKALSRKKKGSANRRKTRIQLAAVHERVASARADFQHKLSRAIVDENQAVIVETLKTASMMKNHHLAHATGNAGWSGFITNRNTNQQRKACIWQCPECGVEHDRDINAAPNIERKGILELQAAELVVSAHGGQRKSVTQTVAA